MIPQLGRYRQLRYHVTKRNQPEKKYRAKPIPVPLGLLPVTRHPHPAATSGHPSAFDPHSSRPWTHDVTARHPSIVGSGPSPITPCPDISGPRRDRLRFNSNGWWSPGHYHLSSRDACCLLSRSCRSCHRRRFSGAAHQSKWCQRQQINAFHQYTPPFPEFVWSRQLGFIGMRPARPILSPCWRINGKGSILAG